MRAADLPGVVEAVRDPIRTFVRESQVRVALLISSSGQVVAQHGFTRGYEIVNVATLAAATHAAAGSLAQLSGAGRWRFLHHAGKEHQLFLAPVRLQRVELIMVAIFDDHSSVGLAQYFFDELARQLKALAVFNDAAPTRDAASFEHDLEAGIDRVFSRDRREEG